MPTRNYRQLDDLPPTWLAEHPSATTNQHTAPHPTPAEADSSTTAPLKHSHGESSLFHPFCTFHTPPTAKAPSQALKNLAATPPNNHQRHALPVLNILSQAPKHNPSRPQK
ncbi:hypothetical protein I6E23_01880 [Prevotella brevis]|nr:hypothetical protein [Xylanibacter brevis]